LIIR
jgi:hypothetical protein